MMYRKHGTTVVGEVVRVALIFIALEAFLIWASTILPRGESLAQLIILFLVVVVVPAGSLAFLVGGVRRGRASQRYRRLTLPELQGSAPAMPVGSIPLTALTIYGNELQTWFEALFDMTFQSGATSGADDAFLTREYVRLLTGLETYMREHWRGSPPHPDENGRIEYAGSPDEVNDLYGTLRWLHGIAGDQAARSDASADRAGPRWDPVMFDAMEINKAVRTACTPDRLRAEIDRLSSV